MYQPTTAVRTTFDENHYSMCDRKPLPTLHADIVVGWTLVKSTKFGHHKTPPIEITSQSFPQPRTQGIISFVSDIIADHNTEPSFLPSESM